MSARLVSAVVLASAMFASAASAQNIDAIKARKEILKSFGAANKDPGAMAKGEVKFDLAKVKAALAAFQAGAPKLAPLFGDDAKTGGETEALPAIWANKKDFDERFVKLAAAAKAAEGTITDELEFTEAWPKLISENCSSCHKLYRKPK
ncbi:MAG: cytochrome c [Verrucomicrobiae bacterium]|nr:cytochrome c [Verrucomicrobiae bacterium]